MLEDGKIEPDSGDGRLQEEDSELMNDTSQFTTDTIDDPEDHYTSENIDNLPSYEKPPEAIAYGGKDAVQLLFISISLAL